MQNVLLLQFDPTTICVVLGYFIYFRPPKPKGRVQMFGRIMAIWVSILGRFSR